MCKRRSKARANDVACLLIASCLDNSTELKQKGISYLKCNADLLQHCNDLIESVRFELQSIIGISLSSLVIDDEQDNEKVYNTTVNQTSTAINMLTDLSRNTYDRQRKSLLKDFPQIDETEIPTHYQMCKDVPPFEEVVLNPDVEDMPLQLDESHELLTSSIDDTALGTFFNARPVLIENNEESTVSSFIGREKDIDFGEALDLLKKRQVESGEIRFTRLVGGMKVYVKMMVDKYKRLKIPLDESILVIDSYDGAEHRKIRGKMAGVVTFSSTICSEKSVKNGNTTAQSLNILTHHQYVGNENIRNLFPVLKDIYNEKALIRSNGGTVEGRNEKFVFFDLHDGKMLYLLTQHSLYSRLHHPFLLCKCHRGEGVKDPNHQCTLISHDDQIKYFERSKKRYENKRKRLKENEKYDKPEHNDWIDVNNLGISHFGLHPNLLPRHKILFDTMHCKMSITRRLLNYTRSFLNRAMFNTQTQREFCDLLSEFWNDHNCLSWIMGGSFQRLIGTELFKFVDNVEKVTNFMKDHIMQSDILDFLCNGLLLWKDICPMMSVLKYENDEDFNNKLCNFEAKLKEFYIAGTRTFLTKNPSDVGNDETFYCHVLRFYLPQIMKQLYQDHRVGLGICTMQGFERRNKESKNTMRRFFNGRGNIILTNMKRLWTVFFFSKNA